MAKKGQNQNTASIIVSINKPIIIEPDPTMQALANISINEYNQYNDDSSTEEI